jgi:hypothetical protein
MSIIPPCKPRHLDKDSTVDGSLPVNVQKPIADIHVDAACPICQEPVGQRTPEGKTEAWSELPCGHKFGSHCIKHWLGLRAEDRPCCPICRQNASHLCGHPVLPELVTWPSRRPTLKIEKSTTGMSKADVLRFTDCVFCLQNTSIAARARKRHKPWRFVKGCWRLVRHGRLRERPATNRQASVWALIPRMRDVEWERWWSNQEPRTA